MFWICENLSLKGEHEKKVRNNLIDLYLEAESIGVDVYWIELKADRSMAVQLEDDTCAIAIDPWKMETIADETVCLAHELGHCKTKSFYNRHTKYDIIKKHENRANKWAIKHIIPADKLKEAMENGHTEIWDLSEYFNVTEDFMRMAVCWYLYGTLETDNYFAS